MKFKFLHPKDWPIELLFVAGILATVVGLIGTYWDIGWHFDFGRDTFWSPPHFFIYGSIVFITAFWLLNLWVTTKTKTSQKKRPLFLLIIAGIVGTVVIYLAAPLDELWHRLYGVDVQIWSLPHSMLIFGGVLGGIATTGIARFHISHERRKFFLEKIVIPVFLGSVLAGCMLIFAESEFPKTLPLDHPVQNRPPWVYPSWLVIFSFILFLVSKRVSKLRFSAVFVLCFYLVLRVIPIGFNFLYGMESVPIFPPYVPLLFGMALTTDFIWRKQQSRLFL